ncbi:MAG: hypothetical protein N4A57_16220 [Anaeromicrobium sp.]|jgi:hypothetical protein|uniref:hypothetical protein n=1 Tax=Anaeromicrobium sp. TaxID=1929132 RepID=UPI0025E5C111|nr:hypothetical protein [Anaeromicrobium sp.]MCT4595793.1 hypothetical protein [Anaeromicrobium sp.]
MEFMHIGVVTDKVQENENYAEDLKVYITDPEASEFKFEYLRFEEDTPLPEVMQKNPHVAFKVNNLDTYLKENDVVVEPFMAEENLRIAFIIKDNLLMELMEEC